MKKLVTSLVLSSFLLAHTNAYAQPQDLLELDNQQRPAAIQQQSWIQPVRNIAWSSFSEVLDNPLTSIAATLGAIWAGNWFFNRDNERPRVPAIPLAGIGNMGGQPPHHNLGDYAPPPIPPANGGAGGPALGSHANRMPDTQAYLSGGKATAALEDLPHHGHTVTRYHENERPEAYAAAHQNVYFPDVREITPITYTAHTVLHVRFLSPAEFNEAPKVYMDNETEEQDSYFDRSSFAIIKVLRVTKEQLEVFKSNPHTIIPGITYADTVYGGRGNVGLRSYIGVTVSGSNMSQEMRFIKLIEYARHYGHI